MVFVIYLGYKAASTVTTLVSKCRAFSYVCIIIISFIGIIIIAEACSLGIFKNWDRQRIVCLPSIHSSNSSSGSGAGPGAGPGFYSYGQSNLLL